MAGGDAGLRGTDEGAPGGLVPVLDAGYVRLVGVLKHFGTDEHEVQVVNAARASFEKEVRELGKRDVGLINFLLRRVENSPFRHSVLAFEVRAPLMIARQWHRYAVGSAHLVDEDGVAWNEASRRYVTEEPAFYCPAAWRASPESKKQGSGGPLPEAGIWTEILGAHQAHAAATHRRALGAGICAEQARLFLPAYGLYVRWRWTASLLAVLHFLDERLDETTAQAEIVAYAAAVRELGRPHFPHSFAMLAVG
ncbi:MAG TPA: FAD-dependent thymidylate synthase [Chloroflexota bacterium]|jgi:thymidylate synthase (FAD)|nr:FAD-dependent thymidylate synthase [Chloroflexota bacterium]